MPQLNMNAKPKKNLGSQCRTVNDVACTPADVQKRAKEADEKDCIYMRIFE